MIGLETTACSLVENINNVPDHAHANNQLPEAIMMEMTLKENFIFPHSIFSKFESISLLDTSSLCP